MMAADRRTLLRLAMAAALAPALATRAGAAAGFAGGRFAPPGRTMTFTRRLQRGLPGGASFVVARSFAIRFAPAGRGWTVLGEQVDVKVAAPERIARLAELERQRRETGLFPLTLDAAGLVADGPEFQPSRELDRAVALVGKALAEKDFAAGERDALEAFVRSVHEAGAKMSAVVPGNLFAPGDAPTSDKREIALPGGGAGTIEVRFSAAADPATGLMRQAQRDIVTAIAGDRRVIREDWTLTLA